jgi:hypothetical protein
MTKKGFIWIITQQAMSGPAKTKVPQGETIDLFSDSCTIFKGNKTGLRISEMGGIAVNMHASHRCGPNGSWF